MEWNWKQWKENFSPCLEVIRITEGNGKGGELFPSLSPHNNNICFLPNWEVKKGITGFNSECTFTSSNLLIIYFHPLSLTQIFNLSLMCCYSSKYFHLFFFPPTKLIVNIELSPSNLNFHVKFLFLLQLWNSLVFICLC